VLLAPWCPGAAARCGLVAAALLLASSLAAQQPAPSLEPAPSRGQRYGRLVIRNAMVIDGAGNPARGPMDLVVEGTRIASVRLSRPVDEFGSGKRDERAPEPTPDRVIDATGMYVMPGIIDVHGHIQFSRNGVPMPKDYEYKLWLGHGITTVREPGSGEGLDTIVAQARLSAENRISAPMIVPYATVGA
jgi:imidazolonepropionase-like amidohydrolase